MGDHHVLERPGGLVEGHPVVHRQGLGYVHLHVVDVVAVPDRLEESVGEAEGQDVLHRLLAQEVVDAEDLVLVEDGVHGVVQFLGALQVGAERLLHDDARPFDQVGFAENGEHGTGRRRRDAQVVEAPDLASADVGFRLGHSLGQAGRTGLGRDETQLLLEAGPLEQRDFAGGVLVAGVPGQVPELLVAQLAGGGADDPVLGHQARHGEVEQSGQQLACRQVASGSE